MVGSSILPACFYKGAIYFLFGKENDLADTPGWSDFGGGVEPGEDLFDAALREGGEEMTGFLGGEKELRALIQKNGGVYKKTVETYNAHIFHYPYDPNLPVYYNNNHRFLWNKMDKKMLNDTKLFEKIEVAWFSIEDMKKRRGEFRNFYQNIVDEIIKDQTKIRQFLTKGNKQSKKIKGGKNRNNKTVRR
jgi:8-oxo-dGTP pyrophosphatase MutT (NUDIX family)